MSYSEPTHPAWVNHPLPFMVAIRDSSFSLSSNSLSKPSQNKSHDTNSHTGDGTHVTDNANTTSSSNGRNNDANDIDTSIENLSVSTEYLEIYPEIRYVFSDDDFAPSIDVLDSNQICHESNHKDSSTNTTSTASNTTTSPPLPPVSLIIDFDESGTKVTNATSLSPSWQISSVKERLSSGTPAPSWAANENMDDTVAHVLYVDGTRPNPVFKVDEFVKSMDKGENFSIGSDYSNINTVKGKEYQRKAKSQGILRKNTTTTIPNSPPSSSSSAAVATSGSSSAEHNTIYATSSANSSTNNNTTSNSNTQASLDFMQQLTINALTKQFLERNRQLRQVIDSIEKSEYAEYMQNVGMNLDHEEDGR